MEEQNKQITQITFTLPADLKIKERARRILALRFEHPEWSQAQLARETGVSEGRVNHILNHPRVLAALPLIGRQYVSGMVPDAVKAYKKLVSQDVNLQVKEKAASRILSEKKVFDAPTIKVEGEITLKHVRELQEIVRNAAEVGISDIVDGEIITDPATDATQSTTHSPLA